MTRTKTNVFCVELEARLARNVVLPAHAKRLIIATLHKEFVNTPKSAMAKFVHRILQILAPINVVRRRRFVRELVRLARRLVSPVSRVSLARRIRVVTHRVNLAELGVVRLDKSVWKRRRVFVQIQKIAH